MSLSSRLASPCLSRCYLVWGNCLHLWGMSCPSKNVGLGLLFSFSERQLLPLQHYPTAARKKMLQTLPAAKAASASLGSRDHRLLHKCHIAPRRTWNPAGALRTPPPCCNKRGPAGGWGWKVWLVTTEGTNKPKFIKTPSTREVFAGMALVQTQK